MPNHTVTRINISTNLLQHVQKMSESKGINTTPKITDNLQQQKPRITTSNEKIQ